MGIGVAAFPRNLIASAPPYRKPHLPVSITHHPTMILSLLSASGMGFLYFIAAIPGGVALGLPWPLAAFAAWAGYSAGAPVVVLVGEPLRRWLSARFNLAPDRSRNPFFWRVWDRFGFPGMCLIAPVTIGPQIGGLVALALGVAPLRLCAGLSLGVIPWCVGFGYLISLGWRLVH